MNVRLTHSRLSLSPRQSLRLADAAGVQVVARSGTLWVTQDHDRRDVILRAGESFTLDGKGHAIVQAFEASCVSLKGPLEPATRPGLETWRERVRRWLGQVAWQPAWA